MHGLYLLWWVHEKQMSPAIVATVLATGDLALMGLELPTGWFADRYGHRASLRVGSLEAVALGALVALVLLGCLLVHLGGFAVGWFAETMLCLNGFGIIGALVEPPSHPSRPTKPGSITDLTPRRYRSLAVSILPAALLGGAASVASFLAQTTGASGPVMVTVLVATWTAAEACGCALASRLPRATAPAQIRLAALGALVIVIAAMTPATLPLVATALAVLLGVVHPLRAAEFQRLAADDIRARAAAASACDMAVSTLVLPMAGIWGSRRRL